jgi:hypothetical protein
MAESETGLPNDPDELTTRSFKLPRLDPDSANTCPHPMTEIIDYLRIAADPDEPRGIGTPANRRFVGVRHANW